MPTEERMNDSIQPFGMIVPAANTAGEMDMRRLLPAHYQVFAARVRMDSIDETGWRQQDHELDYQAQLLATVKPLAVVLLQTSASFLGPEDYDAQLSQRIQTASGAPAIVSASVVGGAVRALGARRVGMVSPYSAELMRKAWHYFERQHGLSISSSESFNITDPLSLPEVGAGRVEQALERAMAERPEALLIVGGAIPVIEHAQAWEQRFGVPVVTTNQALIWAMLKAAGAGDRLPGLGQLLATMPH